MSMRCAWRVCALWLWGVCVSAEVFEDSLGTLTGQILPVNASAPLTGVGTSVLLWSDYMAISAKQSVALYNSYKAYGVVYLFKKSSSEGDWEDTGLSFESGVPSDNYGACMDMHKNVLVVGAPADTRRGYTNGAAYVHLGNAFEERTTLLADEHDNVAYFGTSVAVTVVNGAYDNSLVLVSGYGHSDGEQSGVVYIFSKVYSTYSGFSWTMMTKIEPSHPDKNSLYGKSISASGRIVAVGSPGNDVVYIYRLTHRLELEMEKEEEEREKEEREKEEREHEHEHHDRYRRRLQDDHHGEDGRHEDEGREEDHEREENERKEEEERREEEQRREEEERERNEPDWSAEEILIITSDQGFNSDRQGIVKLNFGCSVSVFNASIPSVAIGASNDGQSSSTGGAYIVTMPNWGHFYSAWTPSRRLQEHDGDKDKEKEDHEHQEQQEREEREQREREEEEKIGYWNIFESTAATDNYGRYWILESSTFGSKPDERYGAVVSMNKNTMAVASPGHTYAGKISVYARKESQSGNIWSNVILRGPVYNTDWQRTSIIYDSEATSSDKFGTSFHLHDSTTDVVIGVPYMQSSNKGAAYLFSERNTDISETYDDVAYDDDYDDKYTDDQSSQGEDNSNPVDDNDPTDDYTDNSYAASDKESVDSEGKFSVSKVLQTARRWKYFLPCVGGLIISTLLVSLYARIRYSFTQNRRPKRQKKVSSLSDIDFSTNSTSPMMDMSRSSAYMDLSTNSASPMMGMSNSSMHSDTNMSSVQMAYTGRFEHAPVPQSRARGARGGNRPPMVHPSHQKPQHRPLQPHPPAVRGRDQYHPNIAHNYPGAHSVSQGRPVHHSKYSSSSKVAKYSS